MEEKTILIFKGKVSELDTWMEAMKKAYPSAYVEVVLEDFKTTE